MFLQRALNTFKNTKLTRGQMKYMTTVNVDNNKHKTTYQQLQILPKTLNLSEALIGGLINTVLSPLHLIGNGFFTVPAQHVAVSTYFKKYLGKHYDTGLNWVITPMGFNIHNIYIGQRTTSMTSSKIIDRTGNPIVVSGIMNYHVSAPEQYLFGVDNPDKYIFNQSDKVLKQVISRYTYDDLRVEGDKIQHELITESQMALDIAGVTVTEFSLTDMNYATEIAQAMLVKQQAFAYNDAKREITRAAGDIINDVLKDFDDILDEKTKSKLVKDMLIVITSGSNVQPVISVG